MPEELMSTSHEPATDLLSPDMEAHLDAALAEARKEPTTIAAKTAEFLPGVRLLLFCLTDGSRFALPVENVKEIAAATDDQLSNFILEGAGRSIHFPDFDGNMHIPTLVHEARSSAGRMSKLLAEEVTQEAA